jgi:hypothetical protein
VKLLALQVEGMRGVDVRVQIVRRDATEREPCDRLIARAAGLGDANPDAERLG